MSWKCCRFYCLYVHILKTEVDHFSRSLFLFTSTIANFVRRNKFLLFYSKIYPTRCDVTQFILSGNSSTCFAWYHHPSSGAQTTVSTASCICHAVFAVCRYRGRVGTGLSVLWVAYAIMVWQIPDAVDTVVCPPDNGWWYHAKHVEQFPDKINCVTLHLVGYMLEHKKKLCGLSPRANYTDRAAAAGRRS